MKNSKTRKTKLIRMTGTAQDVTLQKEAEEKLREGGERFRMLLQNVLQVAVQGYGMDGTTRYWNAASELLYGYSEQEAVGKNLLELIIPPEMRNDVRKAIAYMSSTGRPIPAAELSLMRKDGSRVSVYSSHAIISRPGHPAELFCIDIDLTERKKAEAEREQFFQFFHTSNDLMCLAGLDGYFKMVNPAWTAALGFSREELMQRPYAEFMHPDDVERTGKEVEHQTRGNYTENFINRYRQKDGTYRWLEWKAAPPRDGLIYAIARDVTDRKEAEEKLRQSEQFVRAILDSVDEGFLVIDREYRIVTANRAYCAQFARNCDEAVGRHCYEISRGEHRPCFERGEDCAVRRVFLSGEPASLVQKQQAPDGRIVYSDIKAYPLRDASGGVVSVIETITNITEKLLLEEERLKTQKLESIGTLAGGIAHDFNNLLQGVFGYLSLAKMNAERPEKSKAALEQAEQAMHRSISLTTQLLTFSKGGRPLKKRIGLAPVIESAARFALSGSRTDAVFAVDPGLWQVDADENQLAQVFQNIVLNADQAMPLGGRVVISAVNLPAGSPVLPPALGRGDHVAVTIRDSGVGIPAQYLQKIFDPYFTTKEKGSGLGLATSYSIIKNHNGLIDVFSEAGKGTTFVVYLPAERTCASETTASAEPAGRLRVCRILVMDDEEIVRNVARQLISSLGHAVDFAVRGEEAVEAYRKALVEGRPYDVVILDLTIRGGMGGEETVKRLRELDPQVRAIVSSGYSDNVVVADYGAYGFKACLRKPYDLGELRSVLRGILA